MTYMMKNNFNDNFSSLSISQVKYMASRWQNESYVREV